MQKIMFNDCHGLTQAVLEGRKTMTRRIMTPYPMNFLCVEKLANGSIEVIQENDFAPRIKSRYKVGEIVAVAQAYKYCSGIDTDGISFWDKISELVGSSCFGWDNKMAVKAELMPHQIRITHVRAERLRDITEEDCIKEGIQFIEAIEKYYFESFDKEAGFYFDTSREAFAALIDKVSGRCTWDSNPYVWVYEFELLNKDPHCSF